MHYCALEKNEKTTLYVKNLTVSPHRKFSGVLGHSLSLDKIKRKVSKRLLF